MPHHILPEWKFYSCISNTWEANSLNGLNLIVKTINFTRIISVWHLRISLTMLTSHVLLNGQAKSWSFMDWLSKCKRGWKSRCYSVYTFLSYIFCFCFCCVSYVNTKEKLCQWPTTLQGYLCEHSTTNTCFWASCSLWYDEGQKLDVCWIVLKDLLMMCVITMVAWLVWNIYSFFVFGIWWVSVVAIRWILFVWNNVYYYKNGNIC